jgi:hypothetical protein
MRDILNKLDRFLKEDGEHSINPAEFAQMKQFLAAKIKELPADDATSKALSEIEDLLSNVHAGGKIGIIKGEMQKINDPTVAAAQKEIARYLLSMEMTTSDRNELFKLWQEDKLVKQEVLLGKGKHDFSKVITSYNSNPAIKEFVNDMMRVAALGQGKGEFGLSVLSRTIHKQVGKGDLDISGRPIEVKTTDGGAGRFTDQEVGAGPGFEQAARNVNRFVSEHGFEIPKSGISLQGAVTFALHFQQEDKAVATEFDKQIRALIEIIFGGSDSPKFSASEAANAVADAIKTGNINDAMQEYAQASFNYYMSKKKDEGVLYIGLKPNSIMSVYFKNAKELLDVGMRLHASTVYLTSIADKRLPYPQIEIVDTSFGTDAAKSASKAAADAAPLAKPKALTGGRTEIGPSAEKSAAIARVQNKAGNDSKLGRATR